MLAPVTSHGNVTRWRHTVTSRLTAAVADVRDQYVAHVVVVLQVDGPPRICLPLRTLAANVLGRGVTVDCERREALLVDRRLEGRLAASDVKRVVCDVRQTGQLAPDCVGGLYNYICITL